MGRLVAQVGEALGLAAAMGLPERHCHRVGVASSKMILHGDERAVRDLAVAFEAPDGLFPRGPREITELPPGQTGERQHKSREDARVNPGIETGEQIKVGRCDKQGDAGEQWHETGPQAFPSQSRPRQTDLASQPWGLDRRGGLAGVHRRPFVQAFFGSIQGGSRSAEIMSSTVGLGRVTANLVPSTITSGASGRLL